MRFAVSLAGFLGSDERHEEQQDDYISSPSSPSKKPAASTGAHEALGISAPAKTTLPELLTSLRRKTTFERLLGSGDAAQRAVSSLSSTAENLYLTSHDQGDRHGGTSPPKLTRTGASLFVGACATLLGAFAEGLRRGELTSTES